MKCHSGRNKGGIKIVGKNINNLKYADDTTLMAESEEEVKSLLMKVKEESENVGYYCVLSGRFTCLYYPFWPLTSFTFVIFESEDCSTFWDPLILVYCFFFKPFPEISQFI